MAHRRKPRISRAAKRACKTEFNACVRYAPRWHKRAKSRKRSQAAKRAYRKSALYKFNMRRKRRRR